MSETGIVAIVVASIAGIPGIMSALLANRGRQHARAARTQVENDHSTNLRDDQDQIATVVKHLNSRFALGLRLLLGTKSDVRGIRRDIGRIYDRLDAHDRELDELKGGKK